MTTTVATPRLTSLAHGGGCGCKISPGVLAELLRGAAGAAPVAELLVGTETGDDAAVYRLNESQALIATTDFFMPIVDDPFDFGRIAASNALSDVYAMGGRPILALALLAMPVNVLPPEVIRAILRGGETVCAAAGVPVAGGHSIDSVEPIYGLAALGLVHPGKVKRNCDAQPGDVLILGKALGVGILSAALKKAALDGAGYRALIDVTTRLNRAGPELAELAGVHAMTDVTGFGLLGHLLGMCLGFLWRRSAVGAASLARRSGVALRSPDLRWPAHRLHRAERGRGARDLEAPRMQRGGGDRRHDCRRAARARRGIGGSKKRWSGLTGSNRRPVPWQGTALPTELSPHPNQNGGFYVHPRGSQGEPGSCLDQATFRRSGHAARRYTTIETSVARAATTVSHTPTR
jgi:selenium donor protein